MKSIRKILGFLKPYWHYAAFNVIFNILAAFFALFSTTMLIPILSILFQTQQAVTSTVPFSLSSESLKHNLSYLLSHLIQTHGQSTALLIVCAAAIIATFFKTGCQFLANYFITPIRTGVVRDIRNNIQYKILRLPLSYFTEARKGDIMSRVSQDVQEIEISIMSSLEMVFRDPLQIILSIIIMVVLSPQLTLFVLIMLPISGLLIGRVGKNLRHSSFKGQRRMGTLMSIIEETIGGLRIIKAFNAEGYIMGKFKSTNEFYSKLIGKVMRRRYLASPLSEFLGTIVVITVVWFGGTLILGHKGGLTSEILLTYLAIFYQIINPAKSFSQAYFNIQKGMASSDRIDGILDAEIRINDPEQPVTVTSFNHTIEYRNVWFQYETEPVLRNINLKIEKGKTIALVGKSGSGKSTMVDLLPRFMDVTQGEIFIDGVLIKNVRLAELRGLMGIVSQQSILFNDSFFNNIAFGLKDIQLADVIAAAQVANAHEFISDTKLGYYTNVGESGSKLSGGQRQRVSIARAVLKNPPILILDEATSALDTESERLVQDAILNLMKNRTSIVIAHRLSTIKHADEIVVIDEGEIVERGKHEDLLELNGVYRKLYDMQMFD